MQAIRTTVWFGACAGFMLPLRLSPARIAVRMQVEPSPEQAGSPEQPLDLSKLRQRIEKIQSGGLSTPAQMLFELATEKAPGDVMREFFSTASPQVTEAMQDAVMSLLGSLPPLQFDASMTTTGDRLAALMLQLQMTGYMLRNAEYVFTLRRLLDIKSRSIEEYRAAFDRIDVDGSGYIEPPEVERLLADVYDGEAPAYEASTFLSFFDVDNDGKISWEEFSEALGASEESSPAALVRAALPAADAGRPSGGPKVSGMVTVQLESGNTVEMDAEKYMDELKKEAQSLRAELATLGEPTARSDDLIASSISAYVSTLPEEQVQLLTKGITDDVVRAPVCLASRPPPARSPTRPPPTHRLTTARLPV